MFHPDDHPLQRGWVGRVDGDRVVHLAAQTLQHFFTGGASAREHAEYPLAGVTLLAPVAMPPSVRVFESATDFAFANPAAVVGPSVSVAAPAPELVALPRAAAVVGAAGVVGGVAALLELRAPSLPPPKDRDFALALGPLVVTLDELDGAFDVSLFVDGAEGVRGAAGFDWAAAAAYAAEHTVLRTGDLLAGPPPGIAEGVHEGATLVLDSGAGGELRLQVTS
jgi:hypothetical protein